MRALILIAALPLLLAGCSGKKQESDILKKEKMEAVLWDVLRADAFAFQFITKDTLKKPEAEMVKLQQHIFTVHKTTREVFYKSLEYYRSKPDVFQPILDSMINKYTSEKYQSTKGTIKPFSADTAKTIQ